MGHIVPDRFFWALPPGEEGEDGGGEGEPEPAPAADEEKTKAGVPRRVH
jgi:hydroxymethylpyrimidine/phosphomethylpyrimidine kinase